MLLETLPDRLMFLESLNSDVLNSTCREEDLKDVEANCCH